MIESEPYYFTGDGIEHRPEYWDVRVAFEKIGIPLGAFIVRLVGVYARPRPIGFKFDSRTPGRLRTMAQFRKRALALDDPGTATGRFMSAQASGASYRQIGVGPAPHLEISDSGKDCDAHLDTQGFVMGPGNYDWNRALQHGYWDLGPSLVPGLYGAFGNTGVVGPMVRPMRGVDGSMRWVVGLTGKW